MKNVLTATSTLLCVIGVCACSPSHQSQIIGFPNGIWQSNGYGLVIQVDNDKTAAFDVTAGYCSKSASEHTLAIGIESVVTDIQKKSLDVRLFNDPHTYHFEPIDTLPEACGQPAKNTPHGNFDAFVALMDQHYMFFELYGIDWQQRVTEARQKLDETMTDAALFTLFTEMLAGIDDSHLGIVAEIDGEEHVFEPDPGAGYTYALAQAHENGLSEPEAKQALVSEIWRNQIAKEALHNEGMMVAGNRIQYGMLDSEIGYVGVVTMGGFTEDDEGLPEQELRVLQQSLDQALLYLKQQNTKSLVLDVSFNHGGYDFVSREIASRFTHKPVTGYSKSPADAAMPYTTEMTLLPSARETFDGPVILLTSDMTVSAGEILVLAMRPMPNVVHVGETTRGALSDALEKTLPNGWLLTLSNEVYLDHEKRLWEGKGIAPDIPFPVFKSANPVESFANAMKRVVHLAHEKQRLQI